MLTSWFGFLKSSSPFVRILFVVAVSVGVHFVVVLIRHLGTLLMTSEARPGLSRVRTIASLVTSFAMFTLYFFAVGLIFRELGISLKAYLASASILGLAIGFGSQGLVQDVVTGITLVFANLFDVGDMVEISGQTGIVQSLGMRFTVIENAFGARVYIPNRTIANVINYPNGYVRGIVDVTLADDPEVARQMVDALPSVVDSAFERFPGIFMTPPSMVGQIRTSSGKVYLRVKFRIWPGRGSAIEATLRPEMANALRRYDPAYADWMISVNYEIEKRANSLARRWGTRPKKPAARQPGGN